MGVFSKYFVLVVAVCRLACCLSFSLCHCSGWLCYCCGWGSLLGVWGMFIVLCDVRGHLMWTVKSCDFRCEVVVRVVFWNFWNFCEVWWVVTFLWKDQFYHRIVIRSFPAFHALLIYIRLCQNVYPPWTGELVLTRDSSNNRGINPILQPIKLKARKLSEFSP